MSALRSYQILPYVSKHRTLHYLDSGEFERIAFLLNFSLLFQVLFFLGLSVTLIFLCDLLTVFSFQARL